MRFAGAFVVILVLAGVAVGTRVARAQPASLAEAAARTRVRDDAGGLEAIRRLPPAVRTALGARVLEARLLERVGRLDEAHAAWATIDVERLPAKLRPVTRLRVARLAARTGHYADARRLALALGTDEARALAAECALAMGDAPTARAELDSLRETHAGSIDRLQLERDAAVALVREGRRDEAATRLAAAIARFPAHPDAPALLADLEAIDRTRASRSTTERLAIATILLEARSYERAIAEIDGAHAASDAERAALAHARGTILFAMRRYAEAATAFDLAASGHAVTAIEDEWTAARSLYRLGDDDDARARFERFRAAHPDDPHDAEARMTLATIAFGRADRAPMEALARDVHASRSVRAEAGFTVALERLARSDRAAAKRALDVACPLRTEEAERLACRYFTAVAEIDTDRDRAVAAFVALATDQTHGHYGLLARARLDELGRSFSPASESRSTIPDGRLYGPEEVRFLADLGLVDDAARMLSDAERDPSFVGSAGRARLIAAYLALEDYGRAFRVSRASVTPLALAAEYPLPFARELDPLAAALGVDRFYVLGTMRQESGFRADAVSRVGALGILQMMPTTAERAAIRGGEHEFEPSSLFDPKTSIRLALLEMQSLVERYEGCLPLVAAAYNAGTAKVDGWLGARRGWPVDAFLEAIPFDETRGYVRRVIGHTARYHALDGHPERGPTLYPTCDRVISRIH